MYNRKLGFKEAVSYKMSKNNRRDTSLTKCHKMAINEVKAAIITRVIKLENRDGHHIMVIKVKQCVSKMKNQRA